MRFRRPGWAALVLAGSLGCSRGEPHGPPEAAPPAPPAPTRDEDEPGAGAPAPGVAVREVESPGAGSRWVARVGQCELGLGLDGQRMSWSAESVDPSAAGSCEVLSPAHREGWVALAERAREAAPPDGRVGLVIAFHADPASVEPWFRYQAESEELQALSRGRRDAAYNARVAEHLRRSGALARYSDLLGAMGFALEGVSVEKVEVRTGRAWTRDLPALAGWDLPAGARYALPFLTWLDLRAR